MAIILFIASFFVIGIAFCCLTCGCIGYLLSRSQNLTIAPEVRNFVNLAQETLNLRYQREDRRRPEQQGTSVSTCPICLINTYFTIETNCGHKFCAECMLEYWRTCRNSNPNSSLKCPMCRQLVNCLLPLFSPEEIHSDDHNRIQARINEFNRQFVNDPNLISRFYDLPVLLRHFLADFFSPNGLSMLHRARVCLVTFLNFIYFISPIDVLPEAVLGIFGYLDDFIFTLVTLVHLGSMYRQIVQNRSRV